MNGSWHNGIAERAASGETLVGAAIRINVFLGLNRHLLHLESDQRSMELSYDGAELNEGDADFSAALLNDSSNFSVGRFCVGVRDDALIDRIAAETRSENRPQLCSRFQGKKCSPELSTRTTIAR